MYYTKEPARQSFYKDGKQLLEEQNKEASRKKLRELVKGKKFFRINDRRYISNEISVDLKMNEAILGRALNVGASFIKGKTGYQDVRVIGTIDPDTSTVSFVVKDLDLNIIHNYDGKMLVNQKNNPDCKNVEVEFKWVVMDENGLVAAVAYYPKFLTKVAEGVGLKWKR